MGVGETGVILCVRVLFGMQTELLSVAPCISFFRLYALHGIILEKLLPLLHCLLTKQQFAVYFQTDKKGPVTFFSFYF